MKRKKKKEKFDLFDKSMISLGEFEIVESILYSLGDSIVYPIKTISSIMNRENEDLKIIVLKKKNYRKKNIIDLQTR